MRRTIALGGVATGNMKAIEQDMVVGIIRNKGFSLIETARMASTGSKIFAVAVLDVTSVRKVTMKQIMATNMIGGNPAKATSWSAIQADKPLVYVN